MTSSGPYSQSLNFTHMFDIPDLRGKRKSSICPNSLLAILNDNKNFSFYLFMVKTAGLYDEFMQPQANFTLFIPNDEVIKEKKLENVVLNLDRSLARHIILSTMLNRKITSDLLKISSACKFITRDPPNNLYVKYLDSEIIINDKTKIIISDIEANNGIIHVINNMLIPIII
jgi:transforming growth factor-beta-induced protein|tara:strand:- start:24131 stop:24646 length:516 start_codon:yes stop_codon:yes gene_type:complete